MNHFNIYKCAGPGQMQLSPLLEVNTPPTTPRPLRSWHQSPYDPDTQDFDAETPWNRQISSNLFSTPIQHVTDQPELSATTVSPLKQAQLLASSTPVH